MRFPVFISILFSYSIKISKHWVFNSDPKVCIRNRFIGSFETVLAFWRFILIFYRKLQLVLFYVVVLSNGIDCNNRSVVAQ